MRAYIFIMLLLIASVFLLFWGCREEQRTDESPFIRQLPVNGIITYDTALPPGGSLMVSIEALGGGSNITYFGISMFDGQQHFVLDSGMNHPNLSFVQPIFKGNSSEETWTFSIMNRKREKASIQIHLSKAEVISWGTIHTFDPIVLSAQGSNTPGSFLSLSDGTVFDYPYAEAHQTVTDMIYYTGLYESTFSSPSESEAPDHFPGILNWTFKNETRYDTTALTPNDFNLSSNDSLALVSYEPVNGKRKAKNLEKGMVIAFRNQAGRAGLILVKEVIPGTDGKIECAIKIQE